MGRPILALRGVGKKYSGEYVVKNIDLEVYSGDYIIIMGRSGVGKTSLLRIMTLLMRPDEGDVYFMGSPVDWGDEGWRSRVRSRYFGVLFQGEVLISTLTAYENIALAYRVKGLVPDRDEIRSYMERLGIGHLWNRFPDSYSAGEYQRVAIVRALVTSPEILVLDEPYANLSTDYIEAIEDILAEKNEMGTTIVMTTTELDRRPGIGKAYLLEDTDLMPVGDM